MNYDGVLNSQWANWLLLTPVDVWGVICHPFFYELRPPSLPFPLYGCRRCPYPVLVSFSVLCTLTPLLLTGSHTLLCWPHMWRPQHHTHSTFCMSTAFVCADKHLRNALWLRRPWMDRCCLCGFTVGKLALCTRNIALSRMVKEEAWWLLLVGKRDLYLTSLMLLSVLPCFDQADLILCILCLYCASLAPAGLATKSASETINR